MVLQEDLRRAFSLCREHISSAQKCVKASYDRDLKAKHMQYEPEARVMLFDPTARGKFGKLNNPWKSQREQDLLCTRLKLEMVKRCM